MSEQLRVSEMDVTIGPPQLQVNNPSLVQLQRIVDLEARCAALEKRMSRLYWDPVRAWLRKVGRRIVSLFTTPKR